MKDKLTILFKPYLLILVGMMGGYTLLNWLIFIKSEMFHPKDVTSAVLLPFFLVGGISWFVFRRRSKILQLKGRAKGALGGFWVFIVFSLIPPIVIAQKYLETATGKLTKLANIEQINRFPSTKFYTLRTYYIAKDLSCPYAKYKVSGKWHRDFEMHLYIAMPIMKTSKSDLSKGALAWMGVKYEKTVSNRLSGSEKHRLFQEFISESERRFSAMDVSAFVYLDRIPDSETKDGYMAAARKSIYFGSAQHILVGRNEPYADKNGSQLLWMFLAALIGSGLFLLYLFFTKIDERELQIFRDGNTPIDRSEFLRSFLPGERYIITPAIIYLNVFIFLLMILSGASFMGFDGLFLIEWGANYAPLTLHSDWWRMLTSLFLHAGILHLLFNMYALSVIGSFVEPILGRVYFVIIYLVAGFFGSAMSVWWHEASVSVGASGAIFGLYGFLFVLLFRKVYPLGFSSAFMKHIFILIGLNLLIGFLPGIDNAAHIGGLLSGAVLGLIFVPALKEQIERRAYRLNEREDKQL